VRGTGLHVDMSAHFLVASVSLVAVEFGWRCPRKTRLHNDL